MLILIGCPYKEIIMDKDTTTRKISQRNSYDSILKPTLFDKPENYSSYYDGKIDRQIRVRIRKKQDQIT